LSETADHLKYVEDRVRDLEGLLNRRRQERGGFKQREGMFQTEIMRLQRHIQGISQPISPPAGAEEALDSRLSQKDDEISKLEQEIQEYKVAITKSTRLEGQLSDTRIQIKINDLFSAVRNWALEVVRREKPGEFWAVYPRTVSRFDLLIMLQNSIHPTKRCQNGCVTRFLISKATAPQAR